MPAPVAHRLGSLAPWWRVRTKSSCVLRFAGGSVIVRDLIDVTVGSSHTARAGVALLDVTSSELGEDCLRLLRFHSLCWTLRSHVVPLRAVAVSSATGEIRSLDVTSEVLELAANELVDTVNVGAVAP